MDWTGGARRRYAAKGKNNAILQKQKAHFARAQASQKLQAFEAPDFLHDAIASRSHQPLMSSSHHLRSQHRTDNCSEASTTRHKRRHSGGGCSSSKRHRTPNDLNETSSEMRPVGRHRKEHAVIKQGKAPTAAPPQPTTMTDEERLLLANRERLLARNDWLGLSAARPLRMRFPAASDKDKVGKRRKVHKSKDQKAKPARQRSHTPLFRQELRPRDTATSNAEHGADMHIKIGTDAFATQTQTSRRSHTPANTSMRPPSTEFAPLSEESMLLGVDADGFELKTDHAAPSRNVNEADMAAQTDFTGPSYDFAAPTVSMAPTFQLSQDSEPASTTFGPYQVQSQHDLMDHSYRASATRSNVSVDKDYDPELVQRPDDGYLYNMFKTDEAYEQIQSEDEDDETFRTLMKANATFSGKSSMAAIAPSSNVAPTHPTPAAVFRPQSAVQAARTPQDYDYRPRQKILVPRSDSVVAEHADTTMSEHDGPTKTQTSMALGSPSTSLRQIYRITSRPTEVTQVPAEPSNWDDDDDEALWRSIYLRSQGSDSASSDLAETVRKTWLRKSEDAIESAAYSSSSKAVTEKAQSDRATFGGSILAGYRGSNYDSDPDGADDSEASQHQTNTSMIGHATTVAAGPDDIYDTPDDDEEDQLDPGSFTTGKYSCYLGNVRELSQAIH